MFAKLLIANRGEIACRVIKTARKMGIKTVAVYSEADAGALHVTMADEAVLIGPPAAADSYLNTGRILDAAAKTGAQAIHPGYGFLSENPDFVEAVEAAGLIFVGPSADAIRAMGLKDNAKALMEKAGVPVVPGYHGAKQDPKHLAKEAEAIGYPVLIKARAGGGGKGMRLVEAPGAFGSALEGAMREAQSAFGDPACLIEKFVTKPRHIEVQIIADSHGNTLHLFERDCSLQRRHQKVIEEAPAPDMPQDVREAMTSAAIEAARAVNYVGAGTVEFIVDGTGDLRPDGFWFMEMNTRLQVEHPVTEEITGLDLVELQLRVAAGEALPIAQDDVQIAGHAFEARIYAEDVPAGFLPATGQLSTCQFPTSARIDTGVVTGAVISPHYDPMISKVTVHGPDRQSALSRLSAALEETQITGVTTNVAFLHALSNHEGFANGEVETGLIDQDLAALTAKVPPPDHVLLVAAYHLSDVASQDFRGFRHWSDASIYIDLSLGDLPIPVVLVQCGPGQFEFQGTTYSVSQTDTHTIIASDTGTQKVACVKDGAGLIIFERGQSYRFTQFTHGAQDNAPLGDEVRAPMPGLVKDVSAQPGQSVEEGDILGILEAMKMEHSLAAPRSGIIADVRIKTGEQVDADTVLITLEPNDE